MSSSDTSLRPVADARDVDDCCRCMPSPADDMMGSLDLHLSVKPWQTVQQTKQPLCRQLRHPIGSSCRTMRQGDRYITHIRHRSLLYYCKTATV